jgi:hypothetical protein
MLIKSVLNLKFKNKMMRKVKAVAFFICAVLFAQFVYGQTLNEIINKHIAAMGGREKIMTLSSALMGGTFQATGDTVLIPITTIKKHMIGSRIDIQANQTNNYQIITPEYGWIYTPVQGDKNPRPLMEGQLKSGQVQLDLHGPLINAEQKGYKIEMDGKDTVDRSVCNKLKVSAPNTNVTVYYIDSKSNFIVKASTKMFQFGGLEDVITTFSDYKQNEDGFWFAYTNITPRGKTHYDKIITNVPVDVNIFKTN